MTKKTTSDDLKSLLAQDGSNEADWKRVSKSKNDKGQWVRRFENKETHKQIDVTEISEGKYFAQAVNLTAEANTRFAKDEPAFEVTPEVIDTLVRDGYYPDMPQDQADSVLRSLYRFAVVKDEWGGDAPLVYLSPRDDIRYDESKAVASIIDGITEAADGVYEMIDSSLNTPVAIANYMESEGIAWDKELQDRVEPAFTKELEAWSKKTAAKKPAPKGPKL